jgi:hypothetical protein
VVRGAAANDEIAVDFDLLEKAIREIEHESTFLEEKKTRRILKNAVYAAIWA